ncbi:MAG: ECF transporter S component [Thaumarchaeota archaeon]|nr:ECF transporter S component [Nitrososphaerota archaeon]
MDKVASQQAQKVQITKTQLVASVAVMSALVAILTALSIRIPPLTVFNAGLLGVYIVSILFGPKIGMLSAGLGSGIAELYLMSTRGDPPIFLFGLLAARIPAAGLIGILRKRFPVPGMVAGACLQTAIFLAIDIPILIGIVGSPALLGISVAPSLPLALSFGAFLSWSLPFNILLVVPTYYIVKGIRAKMRRDFLY